MEVDIHTLDFESANLAEGLKNMTDEELNALPFGVILIGADGKVQKYSKREAEQSGYGVNRTPKGLNFFAELAPCMDTSQFRGQIDKAAAAGKVDIELGHTGDFSDRSRNFKVRIISAEDGGFWHLHNRGMA